MLVILKRRVGETIKIGDNVTVRVLEIHDNKIRLGVTAPRDVEVHREEIYDKIREECQPSSEDEASSEPS